MPSGRHQKQDQKRERHVFKNWILPLLVGGVVALAFWGGTKVVPKPVAPVASQVVQTECQINTEGVRKVVEKLHNDLEDRLQGEMSSGQFEQRVRKHIPSISSAVQKQGVKCRAVP